MPVFQRADLLIPRPELLDRWPVIACDQFTSQPDYWRSVAEQTARVPSSYHIIFPEAELGADEEMRIASINRTMKDYLSAGVFRSFPQSYVYVERTLRSGEIRRGLIGVIDLESYDYRDRAETPVRATEKTVVTRIPPRVRIRSGAPIESSHVLLLCNDKDRRLLDSIEKGEKLYDLELMQGGGRLAGWLVDGENADRFDQKLAAYINASKGNFCFAVGDGNHSLAAAKACWEEWKRLDSSLIGSDHPARYAMVELENLFDPVQRFEPIHRIVRGVDPARLLGELEKLSGSCGGVPVRWFAQEKSGNICFDKSILPVDALQRALDEYLNAYGGEIDYIHGEDVVRKLSRQEGAVAFLLPAIEKDELFRSISRSGVLPRKTFSIGHAEEKRYYLECRKILP